MSPPPHTHTHTLLCWNQQRHPDRWYVVTTQQRLAWNAWPRDNFSVDRRLLEGAAQLPAMHLPRLPPWRERSVAGALSRCGGLAVHGVYLGTARYVRGRCQYKRPSNARYFLFENTYVQIPKIDILMNLCNNRNIVYAILTIPRANLRQTKGCTFKEHAHVPPIRDKGSSSPRQRFWSTRVKLPSTRYLSKSVRK